jgi:hypothetical protein
VRHVFPGDVDPILNEFRSFLGSSDFDARRLDL